MDTTKTITHVSLCAGYGGIDLGLARAIPNLRTIAFSEIEAFACANLVAKMEKGLLDIAPIWSDLKTFPWEEFRDRVDLLSGGYPCQPFSAAGKRLGKEDPRHLWPWIADGIVAMRPRLVFFENVEGHISMGLSDVIEDLGRMGYRSTWGIFSASEVGAPHQRKRVFIMAHNDSERGNELTRKIAVKSYTPPLGTAVLLADYPSNRSQTRLPRQEQRYEGDSGITDHGSGKVWPSRPGQPQYEWEPPRVVVNPKESRLQRGGESHTQEWEEHSIHGTSVFGGIADPSNDGAKGMGNASGKGHTGAEGQSGKRTERQPNGHPSQSIDDEWRQTQPSVGRDLDGTASWVGHAELSESDHAAGGGESESWGGQLVNPQHDGHDATEITSCSSEESNEGRMQEFKGGCCGGIDEGGVKDSYAELCTSCDNRTDELRLLGNGVVPATATLAFRTLLKELTTNPTK